MSDTRSELKKLVPLYWGVTVPAFSGLLVTFMCTAFVRFFSHLGSPIKRERERMAFVPEDYWQIRGMGAPSMNAAWPPRLD